MGNKLVMIRITAGYLKTISEGPDGELTFYSSEEQRQHSMGKGRDVRESSGKKC
jgi:hypothetical protein